MTKRHWTAFVVAAGLALPAAAGEKGHKCEASTQACLNKMAVKLAGRGWVGIHKDKTHHEVTIKEVVAGSPAEQAGLKSGDVLVAQNGIAYTKANKAKLKAAYKSFTPGATVNYTVRRGGQQLEVPVTLGEVPRDVLAQWVGNHMLEHADTKMASK